LKAYVGATLPRSTRQVGAWIEQEFVLLAALLSMTTITAKAQDAVKADPQHFKVEFENDQVRVLQYKLGPHEKTAVHEHLGPHVEVQLTDSKEKTDLVGGKETVSQNSAGHVEWEGALGKHTNENIGDTPVETIVVELKGK
jgi:hypothetical protein